MTYFGLSAVGWAAWTAIGTLALAGATVAAIIFAQVQAGKDRRHADAERLAEVKRDNEMRAQDRERDDRLRREAAEERDQREAAEQRAREDYEGRQVVVRLEKYGDPADSYQGDAFTHRITVSTPHAYPIKWVEGEWVARSSGNLGVVPFGFGIDSPTSDDNRTYYSFRARIPATAPDAEPIVKFVDWHGNLYYQYRHFTERFPQNTDFLDAAVKIDLWIRTGPET